MTKATDLVTSGFLDAALARQREEFAEACERAERDTDDYAADALRKLAAELRRDAPAAEAASGNYTQAMSDARSVVTPPATNAEEQDKSLQYAADMADRGWCQDCGHHRDDHGARGAVGPACSWVGCACKEWSRFAVPAGTVKARPHIVDGEFQSDKYPSCPRGKVPLSVKDKTAQDLLWEYAQRRRAVDSDFADDLEFALREAGYTVAAVERIAAATMMRVYQQLNASAPVRVELVASTKHINCQDKDIAEHEALVEKLRAECERLQSEVKESVRERNAAAGAASQGVWVWADTDPNDLVSMGEDMLVTMSAGRLRSLLSERDKQAATEATVAERTRIVAAIRRDHTPGCYPWNMAAAIERGER